MVVKDVELIEFKEDSVVITVFIKDPSEITDMRDIWENKVKSCQPPLVGSYKNGFTVFIPWILKESEQDEG